jgi:SAM-dependent methyltransferase
VLPGSRYDRRPLTNEGHAQCVGSSSVSGNERRSRGRSPRSDSGWDHVAGWYDGWVGQRGSTYHQRLAIPAALELLDPRAGEDLLDVGAGQGVLAPFILERGALYTGIDISPALCERARQRRSRAARFLLGDARRLDLVSGLHAATFDAAVLLLSIQDIPDLQRIVASLDWALRPTARVVILMTHPAFRQPRHSGWGYDMSRKLPYRRVDAYLTPMAVPLDPVAGAGPTWSHHRPISEYVNAVGAFGFGVDAMLEVPDLAPQNRPGRSKLVGHDNPDIPLFLGLRARRGWG